MNRKTILFVVTLVVGAVICYCAQKSEANTASTRVEKYKSLVKEYQTAQEEFQKAYRMAKTDKEREEASKHYPQPQKFAERFLKLAEENPKDPAALDALVWVGVNSYYGAEGDRAMEILARDHVQSDKLGEVCQRAAFSSSKSAEQLLRAALEKNPKREVQGQACLSLAQLLKSRDSVEEVEKYFNRVIEKYSDLKHYRGTLGDAAKSELYELHNLAIGKTAPEIEGKDADGKQFKLSDYRGKVSVLDFWGDW